MKQAFANRSLAIKLTTIGLLILLLLIPISMIDSLIGERQQRRDMVLQDIARSSSYQQHIRGPILAIPYRKTILKTGERNGVPYKEQRQVNGTLYFLPETFNLEGALRTETRARGIYQARLYHAANSITGRFELPSRLGLGGKLSDYHFGQAYISMGIKDIRGIENSPVLTTGNQALPFQPGTKVDFLGDGIHAELKLDVGDKPVSLDFAVNLDLQGTGQMDITPVGKESKVSLTSDWPHPSFIGNYLPTAREVSSTGFNAQWQTSFFSTNLKETLDNCTLRKQCQDFNSRRLGVSLIDPVDQYVKSDRAIKYALLFIALTFAGFFLYEVLKQLAVHPVQYGLVGLSLAFFYLLLLSLAEHTGFAIAYSLSATLCVTLIGYYVGNILNNWQRGCGFGAGLAVLYVLLYGLLSAEDYALLMGSLLVFSLLSLVMILTRKVDWFSLGNTQSKPGAGEQ